MKKLGLLLFICLTFSCVHEEYDMSGDNLNLEIAPFQDGVTLPLGKTEEIRLEDLLKNIDSSFFSKGQDGSYIIGIHDSISMGDELASITEMIDIPDVDFSQDISFQLSDVNVSDIKVDAMDYSYDVDMAQSLTVPDLTIPSISDQFIADAGMTDYVPDSDQMELALEPIKHDATLIEISNGYTITEANDTPIPLTTGALSSHITTSPHVNLNANLSIDVTLPDGISSVEDIILNKNAAIKVSVELNGALLESGNIIPDVTMDFNDIFTLENNTTGIINLKDQLTLNAANSYKNHAIYKVSALNVTESDWTRQGEDGPLTLNKKYVVPVDGEFMLEDLTTTTNRIAQSRAMEVKLTAEFVDVLIDDVVMGIDPTPIVKENSADIDLDIKNIPEQIEKISDITLTDDSGIDIIISAQNLDKITGLTIELESLDVIFPDFMTVEGADADNKITFADIDITNGASKHIHVTGINLPTPENGAIALSRQIEVKASATAGGTIHSADLPSDANGDIHIIIDIESTFEIADYKVHLTGYDYPLDIEDEEISIEIPEELSSLEEITIYPEGEPEITIDLNFPTTSLDIVASEGGLKLSFPQMIRFHDLPASYNYDIATNSITLKEELPAEIVLPIERLVLTPEQDATDEKYYARGKMVIDGGIAVAAGVLTKAEAESISNPDNTIAIIAYIPEIVPSIIDLEEYTANISQEVELSIMKPEDVPAELVSINRIDLYDTKINMQLDASDLPEMGSSVLTVDLKVQLPDIIHVIGADENGIVKISGQVDENGMINLAPIEISHLDLNGIDLKKDGISCNVTIDGSVKLTDATIDIDEVLNKDLEVSFKANMKNIQIEKILGKVDYAVDPIIQEIDLSGFSSMLGDTTSGMNATLDFCHAHLAFEILTNLGVPVDANIELIPYYNGKADKDKTISTSLTLKPSESADNVNATRYFIAQDDKRCPEGYTFIKANILDLIKNIPDKLELRLNANTDSKTECILEPMADYILEANYAFELPLEFGEEFEVVFKTELTGIPSIVGDVLSMGNKVKLAGTFENGLPLGLDLKLNFIDSNGNHIPIEDGACVQYIKPCAPDASAVTTDLNILVALKEGVQADITTLELEFNASPGDVVGVPVTDQAYLKADLKLVLPEGVKVDLKDIFNNEE